MNKNKLVLFTISCILLFSFNSLKAQTESDIIYKKNTIHGSLGTVLFVSTANVFYERILSESTKSRFTTFARVGLQGSNAVNVWSGGDTNGSAFIVQGGIITGQNRSHFEGALGVAYMMSTETSLIPSLALGYRNQVPGKKFMFRIGVGLPELLYVGVGYSF
ncbi:MAG: hypothetical protein U5L09_15425 [Bacteroidales bacterium]|nr:hypothetical protein [Bacteroidales bacterium]